MNSLRELLLEPAGHEDLLDLAAGGLVGPFEEDVADVLLGDGRAALADAAGVDVGPCRPQDRLEVDPGVVPEAFVLDGDDRVVDDLGNLLEAGCRCGSARLVAR